MKILKVLVMPSYLVMALVFSAAMLFIYPYTQVLGIVQNMDVWFASIPVHNLVVYVIFSVMFGIATSFQVYVWRQPKACSGARKMKGAGASGAGSAVVFIVAQCPACASLGALFLPLAAVVFIAQISWIINAAGILLLLFTIHYLGGFRDAQ